MSIKYLIWRTNIQRAMDTDTIPALVLVLILVPNLLLTYKARHRRSTTFCILFFFRFSIFFKNGRG